MSGSPYRDHLDALEGDGPAPLRVLVYDRTGRRLGTIGRPRLAGGTVRDHEDSTARIEVDLDHHLAPALQAPGARVEVHRDDDTLDPDERQLVAGWVVAADPTSGPDSTLAVDVLDYEAVVGDLLAWPVPGAALTAQRREQWRSIGPAETVVKALIRENASRQARRIPVYVAPSQGRGRLVSLVARMDRVDEVALAVLEQADLRVVVKPSGPVEHRTGLLVDVVPRTVYPTVLTEAAGIVVTSSGRLEGPTATRVVVGGGGEGVDRDFRSLVDTAREAAWAREVEVFVDARDARSELDEARRDASKAAEDVRARRGDLGDALRERRATMAEESMAYNQVVAISNDRVRAAEVKLVKAEAARDRLPSTATQTQKDSAAAAVTARETDLAEAETKRTEDVAAAAADRVEEQRKQDGLVVDAERALSVAGGVQLRADALAASLVAPYEADLLARMETALAEGAPKASVSVQLSETATFGYGRAGLVVGARVTLGLARDVEVVERLRSVEWSWTAGAPLGITPQVGDAPPDIQDRFVTAMWRMVRAVGAIATANRQQSTRR